MNLLDRTMSVKLVYITPPTQHMDCHLSEIKSELIFRCWQSSQYYTANITYSILSVISLNGLF